MQKAELTKIEYEVTYSSSGKCPHCSVEINTRDSEVISDSFGDRKFAEKTYHNCLLNIENIRQTWAEKVKEKIPIVSKTECTTVYVLEGECPYCGKNITVRENLERIYNSPPEPDPTRYKEIHLLNKCPECNNQIHISGGDFYTGDQCPDDIRTASKQRTGRIERSLKHAEAV
ncbi:MAG: hypothetical protein Q8S44_06970 [Flavobacteriaceae bacterium]|uniref:Putative transcriptional activator protein n=1 Tax=viral metagenome TaxID=1070528 RepID=A0A6M3XYR4_9ZZZZ|nr:hypothetical protein [Flavobacteriaceae bacterium]